jgi:hypothetical protein
MLRQMPQYRRMIAPRCTSCGRTVLELRGQFAFFDSFLTSGDEPPPDTTGAWHIPCLEAAGIGPRWHAAVVKSLVDVRRYTVLGRADGWVAVRPANGEPIAVSPLGAVLSLQFRTAGRKVEGGLAFAVHEREYNLELDDTGAIEKLQSALRAQKSISLLAAYEAIGIADRLVRPDLQTDAAFLLEDPDVADEWTKRFVCAAVSYSVLIPTAVAAFVPAAPRGSN